MTRRFDGSVGSRVSRNANPRLRVVSGAQAQNPYDALRRRQRAGRWADPRPSYRQFVRRLWEAA